MFRIYNSTSNAMSEGRSINENNLDNDPVAIGRDADQQTGSVEIGRNACQTC